MESRSSSEGDCSTGADASPEKSTKASPETHMYDIPKAEFYYEFDDMNKIAVKLSSKCFHIEAVEYLEKYLTEEEMRYFTEESPFRHIFHMKKKQSLKMSVMVALINRAVKTKKDDELWFVINGCPIRRGGGRGQKS
ncbi:PREDICTED: uncharacterized protein At3g43530-like [Tarenaya hassleriana]|uniref:uncharacterized protein At3g43530-like n=1 Tax=Tarenaya hassleriana TaxID=28532 RepID=UPI00053C449E|nr:PREDICTED: uncharacterized protein At3g43530-like [Tarenaya hassleriana]